MTLRCKRLRPLFDIGPGPSHRDGRKCWRECLADPVFAALLSRFRSRYLWGWLGGWVRGNYRSWVFGDVLLTDWKRHIQNPRNEPSVSLKRESMTGMKLRTISRSLGQTVTVTLMALVILSLIGAVAFEIVRLLIIHNTN